MDPIRQWFVDHEDAENVEFLIPPRGCHYTVIPPNSKSQPVLYTTKPYALSSILGFADDLHFGFVGHNGLPHESEFDFVGASLQGHPVLFLGDADPCDLLIFAWLRVRTDVSYCGLSDSLLARCGVSLDERTTIPMSPDEVASMPFLAECLPEYATLLGPQCSALLSSRRKVELEALTSFSTLGPEAMVRALVP